jgi:hypothetical protein
MTDHPSQQIRELDPQGNQLANLAEGDPGNTDPEKLTAPLDADDDVYALLEDQSRQLDQGDHQ